MNINKYIKYKSKYLKLCGRIHNRHIISNNMEGGGTDDNINYGIFKRVPEGIYSYEDIKKIILDEVNDGSYEYKFITATNLKQNTIHTPIKIFNNLFIGDTINNSNSFDFIIFVSKKLSDVNALSNISNGEIVHIQSDYENITINDIELNLNRLVYLIHLNLLGNKKIFVCCADKLDYSISIIAAYIIIYYKISFINALIFTEKISNYRVNYNLQNMLNTFSKEHNVSKYDEIDTGKLTVIKIIKITNDEIEHKHAEDPNYVTKFDPINTNFIFNNYEYIYFKLWSICGILGSEFINKFFPEKITTLKQYDNFDPSFLRPSSEYGYLKDHSIINWVRPNHTHLILGAKKKSFYKDNDINNIYLVNIEKYTYDILDPVKSQSVDINTLSQVELQQYRIIGYYDMICDINNETHFISIPDNQFEIIIAESIPLLFFHNPLFFKIMHRIIKPNGNLLILYPNIDESIITISDLLQITNTFLFEYYQQYNFTLRIFHGLDNSTKEKLNIYIDDNLNKSMNRYLSLQVIK